MKRFKRLLVSVLAIAMVTGSVPASETAAYTGAMDDAVLTDTIDVEVPADDELAEAVPENEGGAETLTTEDGLSESSMLIVDDEDFDELIQELPEGLIDEGIAEEPEGTSASYPLWIGGVQLDADTANDYDCGNGVHAIFDYDSVNRAGTLTFTGSGTLRAKNNCSSMISSNGIDLTIEGNVKMYGDSNCNVTGIDCDKGTSDKGNLTINGGLTIDNFRCGIKSNGSITIDNNVEGTEDNEVVIRSSDWSNPGIQLTRDTYVPGKSLTLKGNSKVCINYPASGSAAINLDNADLNIKGEGIEIDGDYSDGGIYITHSGNCNIEDASVWIDICGDLPLGGAIKCNGDITLTRSHVESIIRSKKSKNISSVVSSEGKFTMDPQSYLRAESAGNAKAISTHNGIFMGTENISSEDIAYPAKASYVVASKTIIDDHTGKAADLVELYRNFGVYVGSTKISAENYKNIPVNGGTASFIYDQANKKGTLSFNGTVAGVQGTHENSLIYWQPSSCLKDLTITTGPKGEGSLNLKNSTAKYGIYCAQYTEEVYNLCFAGSINVEMTKDGSKAIYQEAVKEKSYLCIEEGSNVSVKGKDVGLDGGGVTVKSLANLNAAGDTYAVSAGMLTIDGGFVNAKTSGKNAIKVEYDSSEDITLLNINSGDLMAETTNAGTDAYAISIRKPGGYPPLHYGSGVNPDPAGAKLSHESDDWNMVESDGTTPVKKVRISNVTLYGLWVGEVQVNSLNKDNIPVHGGTATYKETSTNKTLTLTNVTGVNGVHAADSKTSLIYNNIENLQILVSNTTLVSDSADYAIKSIKPFTILSSGSGNSLTASAKDHAIFASDSEVKIPRGIYDLTATGSDSTASAIWASGLTCGNANNNTLKLTAKGSKAIVVRSGSIDIKEGFGLIDPEGAAWEPITGSTGYYAYKKGESYCNEVTLGSTFYDVWIGGTQLSKSQKSGTLGTVEGKKIDYSYDDSKKTLTLKPTAGDSAKYEFEGALTKNAFIYAKDMDLTVSAMEGNVEVVDNTDAATNVNNGVLIENGSLTMSGSLGFETKSGDGVKADKITIVPGANVTVQAGNSNFVNPVSAISAKESFTMNGKSLSVNAINKNGNTARAYGIYVYAEGGVISLNDGTVYASGFKGTDEAGIAIKANNGTLISDLQLKVPERGIIKGGTVLQPGKHVNAVEAPKVYFEGKAPKKYKVEFMKGTTVWMKGYVNENSSVSEPLSHPYESGKVFDCWCSDEACTTRYDFNSKITADTKIYARFLGQYHVTFDRNGHGYAPSPQPVLEGEKAVRPAKPDNDGDWKFYDWYTSAECKDDEKYDFDTPVTGDIVLYAKWIGVETFTVNFNLNGHGDATKKPASQSVKEGGKATKPATDPEDANFKFVGWYREAAGTTLYDFNTPISSDITLYAKWVKKTVDTVTVKFTVANGIAADLVTPVPDQIIEKGKKAAEPDTPVAKESANKAFVGWYTASTCKDDEKFDFKKTAVNENITLYAKWITIDPTGMLVNFGGDDVTYSGGRYIHYYTSYKITPELSVRNSATGENLIPGVDYAVSYRNNINVDKNGKPAIVTVKGKGNYSGTKKLLFYILPKSIGDGTVSGNHCAPEISIAVTSENKILVKEKTKVTPVISYGDYQLKTKDYTVVLSNGANKFTTADKDKNPTVDIIGRGNFSGIIKGVKVNILSAADMKKATIKVSLEKGINITYDGTRKTLGEKLIVKDGANNILSDNGINYEVRYFNNIDAGTAKVIVTGKGNYTGTATKSFKINPDKTSKTAANITTTAEDILYVKGGAKPDVKVTASRDGKTILLTEGKDYKLAYSKHKKVQASNGAVCKVDFIGNYKGQAKIQLNYSIKPAKFNDTVIGAIADDKVYVKPGKYISKPYVYVKAADGRNALLSTADYEVASYKVGGTNITKNSKYTLSGNSVKVAITLKGKGNYEANEVVVNEAYSINKIGDDITYDLTSARIFGKGTQKTVAAQQYTGKEIMPEVDVYGKKTGSKTYETTPITPAQLSVTYINNVDKGNAVIIVKSKTGKIIGSKTVKFKIGARGFANLIQILK